MSSSAWYVHHLQAENAELSAAASEATDAADADAKQFADLQAKADAMAATISQLETEKAVRATKITMARDTVAKTARRRRPAGACVAIRAGCAQGAAMKRLITIVAVLLIAGCGDQQPIVKLVPAAGPQIPDSLLTCPASPDVPGDDATQADVGKYMLDLYAAGADCRSNLGAVKAILKPTKTPAGER